MNKKLLISLGLMTALSVVTVSAYADTTIYTDGIGRMHFLGKDAASNSGNKYNYSNSAEQDLTRKLYEKADENGVINDTSFDQHPLKNYENTFPDSRFNTAKYWKTKYDNGAENAIIDAKGRTKSTMTFEKTPIDTSNPAAMYNTNINTNGTNTKKATKKKHWWNKNK